MKFARFRERYALDCFTNPVDCASFRFGLNVCEFATYAGAMSVVDSLVRDLWRRTGGRRRTGRKQRPLARWLKLVDCRRRFRPSTHRKLRHMSSSPLHALPASSPLCKLTRVERPFKCVEQNQLGPTFTVQIAPAFFLTARFAALAFSPAAP